VHARFSIQRTHEYEPISPTVLLFIYRFRLCYRLSEWVNPFLYFDLSYLDVCRSWCYIVQYIRIGFLTSYYLCTRLEHVSYSLPSLPPRSPLRGTHDLTTSKKGGLKGKKWGRRLALEGILGWCCRPSCTPVGPCTAWDSWFLFVPAMCTTAEGKKSRLLTSLRPLDMIVIVLLTPHTLTFAFFLSVCGSLECSFSFEASRESKSEWLSRETMV